MDLVTVTPLAQTTTKNELSYFTDLELSEGSIVSVSIRNRVTPAMVVGKESVTDAKTRIKAGEHKFKKIDGILAKKLYSADVIEAARMTSEFYAIPLGGILKAVTPKSVLDDPPDIEKDEERTVNEMKPESMVLQLSRDERMVFYKQYIRGALARGRGVFICVPGVKDVEYISNILKKGIEHVTLTLHGNMKANETRRLWESVSDGEPKLIVATALFLSAFDGSFDTLILERESSDSYYTGKRPFFDFGYFAEALAKKTGAKFIAADSILSVETYEKYLNDRSMEAAPIRKNYRDGAKVSVIDMISIEDKEKKNSAMPFLSSGVLKAISESHTRRCFVYTARRGLSPTTTCGDCGYTFFCDKCFSPMVLHGKRDKRLFICHTCGNSEDPDDECPKCGSWKLVQLGIGSERVAKLLQRIFPKREVIRLDSDNASTPKKEKDLWNKFKETPGSILVGTEMALNNIRTGTVEIDTVAIASIDSLLTHPNYSSGEKVFRILMELTLMAGKNMMIQTRLPEQRLLLNIKEKRVSKFFEDELDMREKLSYPPYTVPMTVTFSGNKYKVDEKERTLESIFNSYDPLFYRSITEKVRGQKVKKMLIRVPRSSWPDRKLLEILRSLSPEYKVAVHPPIIV